MAGAGAVGFPRELIVQRIQSLVEEGFWDALRRLKLDVLGTDDSPIPITGPRAHNPLSSLFVCRIRDLGQGTNADPLHFRAPLPDFRRAQPALSCLPVTIQVCLVVEWVPRSVAANYSLRSAVSTLNTQILTPRLNCCVLSEEIPNREFQFCVFP